MSKGKIHLYADEDGEGKTIWVQYNPKFKTPDTDTITVTSEEYLKMKAEGKIKIL